MKPDSGLKGVKAVILTVSDSRSAGQKEDESGLELERLLEDCGAVILSRDIVCDDVSQIAEKIKSYADILRADLVLTTGGTGLGPRDVTPEATRSILDKEAPGLAEWIRFKGREKTIRSVLSRGLCGLRGRSLIVNLPGSPVGARESLEAVLDVLPHALAMAQGEGHDHKSQNST